MSAVKVSVIIPVYNAEEYLEQCLDSVVRQTLQDIEIICIDDGSSDRSPDILRRYAATDTRFHIVSQNNCGAGKARNTGIDTATGEYIAFLDSDDWLVLSALEKLYMQAAGYDADICICGRINHMNQYGEDFTYQILPNPKLYPQEQSFCLDQSNSFFDFADIIVWNKLYRRSFLEEKQIRFPSAKRAEDIYFTTIAACSARKMIILPDALIHYRVMRTESLTGTIYQNPEEYLDVWAETAEELRNRGIFLERCIANLAWASILWLIPRTRWSEYSSLYKRVKTELVSNLGVKPCEPGYFYFQWHEDMLKHLYQESAEEFLLSYLSIAEVRTRKGLALRQSQSEKSRVQIDILQKIVDEEKINTGRLKKIINDQVAMIDTAKKENEALRSSWFFRAGRLFSRIPGKMKTTTKRQGQDDF